MDDVSPGVGEDTERELERLSKERKRSVKVVEMATIV